MSAGLASRHRRIAVGEAHRTVHGAVCRAEPVAWPTRAHVARFLLVGDIEAVAEWRPERA
ncbi:MAG: hypothetical protein HY850_04730 [Betaproteobacteria bacterium]|nr:hypothetical protein [Betaproteobacteria bacterium]